MPSVDVFLKGKLKWCQTTKPDQFGNWKVTLYPDKESMDIVNQLKEKGLKNVIGKDEDGYHVTFRRPQNKKVRGELRGFTAPVVLHSDGTICTEMVGNGSDGYVKIEVYDYKSPVSSKFEKAARLTSIRVDNLVPYMRDSLPKLQAAEAAGLPEQKQMF
jgi:hypothetical protein